jgi:hypothetical protein
MPSRCGKEQLYPFTLSHPYGFRFSLQLPIKWWASFGFLHHSVAKRSNVLEECTAAIYRVNELVQVDAEVIQRKKWVNYNRGQLEGIYQSQVWKVRWGTELSQANGSYSSLRFPQEQPFQGFTSGICKNNLGGDCGAISACC